MESTGEAGKIQISETTAKLLIEAGKTSWIHARDDKVHAKGMLAKFCLLTWCLIMGNLTGKGEMQTYWLGINRGPGSSVSGFSTHSGSSDESVVEQTFSLESIQDPIDRAELDSQVLRLIDWNVELLKTPLKNIIARREVLKMKRGHIPRNLELGLSSDTDISHKVAEVMDLPPFDPRLASLSEKAEKVELTAEVETQLKEFVTEIAKMYNNNSFHNFSHGKRHVLYSICLTRDVLSFEQTASHVMVRRKMNIRYAISSNTLCEDVCA